MFSIKEILEALDPGVYVQTQVKPYSNEIMGQFVDLASEQALRVFAALIGNGADVIADFQFVGCYYECKILKQTFNLSIEFDDELCTVIGSARIAMCLNNS